MSPSTTKIWQSLVSLSIYKGRCWYQDRQIHNTEKYIQKSSSWIKQLTPAALFAVNEDSTIAHFTTSPDRSALPFWERHFILKKGKLFKQKVF